MRVQRLFGIVLIYLSTINLSFGENVPVTYKLPQWSFLAYYAQMTDDDLRTIITPRKLHFTPGRLYALNGSYIPSPECWLQHIFNVIGFELEANLNAALLADTNGDSYQLNPYVSFRWGLFPWNHYLRTTFALGDGVSIASNAPAKEYATYRYSFYRKSKFDNFFIMELTFALPEYDKVQLAFVAHHRCPLFNTLDPRTHGASTAYGIGLRYLFY